MLWLWNSCKEKRFSYLIQLGFKILSRSYGIFIFFFRILHKQGLPDHVFQCVIALQEQSWEATELVYVSEKNASSVMHYLWIIQSES